MFAVTICQVFVPYEDLDASLAFYRDLLGFAVRDSGRPGRSETVTVAPSGTCATSLVLEPADPAPDALGTPFELLRSRGCVQITLATDDPDGIFERLEAADVEVIQEPIDRPGGIRDCAFFDPAGNTVRIRRG